MNRKDYNGVDKRTGAPYTAQIVGVFDGSRWYSYFDRRQKSYQWRVGDTIEMEVKTSTDRMGKLRYDIDFPSPEAKLETLEQKVEKLERFASKAAKILDTAFPGWREDVYATETSTPPASRTPLNVDQIAQEIENMEVAKSKMTQEKNGPSEGTGTIWG